MSTKNTQVSKHTQKKKKCAYPQKKKEKKTRGVK